MPSHTIHAQGVDAGLETLTNVRIQCYDAAVY